MVSALTDNIAIYVEPLVTNWEDAVKPLLVERNYSAAQQQMEGTMLGITRMCYEGIDRMHGGMRFLAATNILYATIKKQDVSDSLISSFEEQLSRIDRWKNS